MIFKYTFILKLMTNNFKIEIFSFFSGIGFLDFGFEKSSFDIVYINEIFKPFLEAYRYSRTSLDFKEPKYGYFNGDINQLLTEKSNEFHEILIKSRKEVEIIGFIGGPPCPDFSVGGKNKGQNSERGKLSKSYIDLICKEKPDFFLFENVKGLWRTKIHRQFYEELKSILHDNGYITSERMINAIEYGVPQDRDRIILFGCRKQFFNFSNLKIEYDNSLIKNFPWQDKIIYKKEHILNLNWPKQDNFVENSIIPIPGGLPLDLTIEFWFKKNNVYDHFNSNDYFKPRSGLVKMQNIMEGDVSKKSYKRLHRWRYSPTTAYGNNEVHLHPYKTRRLSVSEALAIQSLPEEFHLPHQMSLTNKFKAIGNGVPFLAAKSLAETILLFLEANIK